MRQLKAIYKYVLSFGKTNWKVEDYPVTFKYIKSEAKDSADRLMPVPWCAQIINWWQMAGYGHSKEDAYKDLRKKIDDYFTARGHLPRPGTKVPLEFVSSVNVDRYEKTAKDFFARILGMNYDRCFISDESSLWDFHFGDSNEKLLRKIKETYDVDVSDIQNGNLARIFSRLSG